MALPPFFLIVDQGVVGSNPIGRPPLIHLQIGASRPHRFLLARLLAGFGGFNAATPFASSGDGGYFRAALAPLIKAASSIVISVAVGVHPIPGGFRLAGGDRQVGVVAIAAVKFPILGVKAVPIRIRAQTEYCGDVKPCVRAIGGIVAEVKHLCGGTSVYQKEGVPCRGQEGRSIGVDSIDTGGEPK